MKVTLVIPCYNEAENVDNMYRAIEDAFLGNDPHQIFLLQPDQGRADGGAAGAELLHQLLLTEEAAGGIVTGDDTQKQLFIYRIAETDFRQSHDLPSCEQRKKGNHCHFLFSVTHFTRNKKLCNLSGEDFSKC